MEDFRSRSYSEGRSANSVNAPYGMQDLRCYSTSYATSVDPTRNDSDENDPTQLDREKKVKKDKSGNGGSSWGFGDPDLRRKKRVASYKAYTVEGKLKGSLRKSFRWIKDRCSKIF